MLAGLGHPALNLIYGVAIVRFGWHGVVEDLTVLSHGGPHSQHAGPVFLTHMSFCKAVDAENAAVNNLRLDSYAL